MELILLPTKDTLRSHYRHAFENAVELYVVSAYLTEWDATLKLGKNCKKFRLIVGTDFGITRKAAIKDVLAWLPARRSLQFLVADEILGFHPKAMFWRESNGACYSLVGSSNLTSAAFSSNYEANVLLQLGAKQFNQARAWVSEIESLSLPVSQAWLQHYIEAPYNPRRAPLAQVDAKSQPVNLVLPLPGDENRLIDVLRNRRLQLRQFKNIEDELDTLIRVTASDTRWSSRKNETFYSELNRLWNMADQTRLQGAGWDRQGKGSDFRELCRSLVSIFDIPTEDRDDLVADEIDRLAHLKVSTRGALLSEMLCLHFPNAYPVLNRPVKNWLADTNFNPPRRSTEGDRYIDLAKKLRVALRRNPEHPARNIAELDAVIWLADEIARARLG